MFNPYYFPYQSYVYLSSHNLAALQNPNTITNLCLQNNAPLIFQQFVPENRIQNCNLPPLIPLAKCHTISSQAPVSNKMREMSLSNSTINVRPSKNMKEKIIKKPANRPATYLTERKYYLGQSPLEDQDLTRKLRPRNLKKQIKYP